MDIASAAVRDAEGQFPMTMYRGIRSEAYRALKIMTGAGLGGLASVPASRSGSPTVTDPA